VATSSPLAVSVPLCKSKQLNFPDHYRTTTGLGFYAASKKALEALHEGEAALLWHEWGINMTLLQCGNIITNTEHMVEKLAVGPFCVPLTCR
jgi:NAD(P)-dependent dehydrogenase (short-subunit alcohol dehydrogenase family)